MPLTVPDFVLRWKIAGNQTERQVYQEHFRDICALIGQPTPVEHDPEGNAYCFERHVAKTKGGKGFADVWKRGYFAWEYKGKHKDLRKAYEQLQDYRVDLMNPPLLVVSDIETIRIHTNFPNTQERVYEFTLDDLKHEKATAKSVLPPLELLRALFGDYNVLRPNATAARVTEEAARKFLDLAKRLEIEGRTEKPTREQIAHFLMRVVFCLFADSIGLLPEHVFRNLVRHHRTRPRKFRKKLTDLFEAMADDTREGYFGEHDIKFFNGGLFNDSSTIELNEGDMGVLYEAANNLDWSHVEPSIFGTLFERSLDADKRSLIGAHYTSPDDILLLVKPVILQPLRRRWDEIKAEIEAVQQAEAAEPARGAQSMLRARSRAEDLMSTWFDELTHVRVLDPACGSGNFLYIALQQLLNLWKETRDWGISMGLAAVRPGMVSPRQLYGIETDFYAHEIASVVVWIGWLQWIHEHGEPAPTEPILQKLDNIQKGDAILRYDKDGKPYEPEWPESEYIVGNPPFLGGSDMLASLNEPYVKDLRYQFLGRVPGGANLVTYWFAKASGALSRGRTQRAGFIATQAIRRGSNRRVLDAIAEQQSIFMAWSNRPWLLDGASVRISLIAFDNGQETNKLLDGRAVAHIHSDLEDERSLISRVVLQDNKKLGFKGFEKNGSFELTRAVANRFLSLPLNINNRPNSDVIVPWLNHHDLSGRRRDMFVIDFGESMTEHEAAQYEEPFHYIQQKVLPERLKNADPQRRKQWWRFGRSGKQLRQALRGHARFIATGRVSKHRYFVWLNEHVCPDSRLYVIASESEALIGLLHSAAHTLWATSTASRHGDGDDGGRITYNSECFETFPFPWPPGKEPQDDPRVQAIAAAAKNLVELRDKWLNPPDISDEELQKRTLTNLYNKRPQWLADAHRALDCAVFAAYGWPDDLSDQQILEHLLALNHERAAAQAALLPPAKPKKKPRRTQTAPAE